MIAFYDSKPAVMEAVGNGSYLYRWGIAEERVEPMEEGMEERVQWRCEEVTIWPPITSNRITDAVISEMWPLSYEQKLINEYNSAMMGLYGEAEKKTRIEAYNEFLLKRIEIKEEIDEYCKENKIV